jgi:hypothetical protein
MGIDWNKVKGSSGKPLGEMLDALEAHFGSHAASKEAVRAFREANQMVAAGKPAQWVPVAWAVDVVYRIHINKESFAVT